MKIIIVLSSLFIISLQSRRNIYIIQNTLLCIITNQYFPLYPGPFSFHAIPFKHSRRSQSSLENILCCWRFYVSFRIKVLEEVG